MWVHSARFGSFGSFGGGSPVAQAEMWRPAGGWIDKVETMTLSGAPVMGTK